MRLWSETALAFISSRVMPSRRTPALADVAVAASPTVEAAALGEEAEGADDDDDDATPVHVARDANKTRFCHCSARTSA